MPSIWHAKQSYSTLAMLIFQEHQVSLSWMQNLNSNLTQRGLTLMPFLQISLSKNKCDLMWHHLSLLGCSPETHQKKYVAKIPAEATPSIWHAKQSYSNLAVLIFQEHQVSLSWMQNLNSNLTQRGLTLMPFLQFSLSKNKCDMM